MPSDRLRSLSCLSAIEGRKLTQRGPRGPPFSLAKALARSVGQPCIPTSVTRLDLLSFSFSL